MKRKYLILFSLSGLVLCFDQWMKHFIEKTVPENEHHALIPGFLSAVHTHNNGIAFGLLQKAPQSLQEVFFIAVPVFALILIVLIFIKLQDDQMLTSVALTSILGGAVGNLVDRLQYGYVVDVIDLHWQDHFHIPAFNVADCSIFVGVLLMFINTLLQERTAQ